MSDPHDPRGLFLEVCTMLRDLQAQDLADGTMGPYRFCRHEDYLDHSPAAATGIMIGFLVLPVEPKP